MEGRALRRPQASPGADSWLVWNGSQSLFLDSFSLKPKAGEPRMITGRQPPGCRYRGAAWLRFAKRSATRPQFISTTLGGLANHYHVTSITLQYLVLYPKLHDSQLQLTRPVQYTPNLDQSGLVCVRWGSGQVLRGGLADGRAGRQKFRPEARLLIVVQLAALRGYVEHVQRLVGFGIDHHDFNVAAGLGNGVGQVV